MADEKKGLDQLAQEDLKEVKGGIPYEKPVLLDIATTLTSCIPGIHCDSGFNGGERCATGITCSTGSHGTPDPGQEPD